MKFHLSKSSEWTDYDKLPTVEISTLEELIALINGFARKQAIIDLEIDSSMGQTLPEIEDYDDYRE